MLGRPRVGAGSAGTGHSFARSASGFDASRERSQTHTYTVLVCITAYSARSYGTAMEMLARSVPGVADMEAQKSVRRIHEGRPAGRSRLGISGSSAGVKSLP